MGLTKEIPTGSTSEYEQRELGPVHGKIGKQRLFHFSVEKRHSESCVLVHLQEGTREQERILRRTAERRQKRHWPANGHK